MEFVAKTLDLEQKTPNLYYGASSQDKSESLQQITSISFTLSNSCNLLCSFCPRTRYGVNEKQIKPSVLESILAFANKLEKIQILGLGEPLMSRGFLGIMKDFKATGAQLSFTTNGLLLSENVCRQLCRNEIDEVVISMQGAQKKTHEKGKTSRLEVLLDNVKRFSTVKRHMGTRNPSISFNFVGLTSNIAELAAVVELAHAVGVDQVYVANVVPFDQDTCRLHLHRDPVLASHYFNVARERADELGITLTVYASLSPKPMACRWSTRPHIGLEGDVYPCNFIGAQDSLQTIETIWYEDINIQINVSSFRLGNLQNQGLADIWNSQRAAELRCIPEHTLEQDCTVKWGPQQYRELLQRHQGRRLTPQEVCRICPHRFKVTH